MLRQVKSKGNIRLASKESIQAQILMSKNSLKSLEFAVINLPTKSLYSIKDAYNVLITTSNYTTQDVEDIELRLPNINALKKAGMFLRANTPTKDSLYSIAGEDLIDVNYHDILMTPEIKEDMIDNTRNGLKSIYSDLSTFFHDYDDLKKNQGSKDSLFINGVWVTQIIEYGTKLAEIKFLKNIPMLRKEEISKGGFQAGVEFNKLIELYLQEAYH